MKKICAKCFEEKPISDFWKQKTTLDGFNKSCKNCASTYVKKGKPKENPSWFKKGHKCIGGFETRIKKGQHLSVKTQFKKGQTALNKGISPSEEVRTKIREKLKGFVVPLERRIATSIFQKNRVKEGKHNNYKGGISKENQKIRASFEYKIWRESVFERDSYTCVLCGAKNEKGLGKSVILHADHILPFSTHPEKRFDLLNGRTLCKPCHEQTPTYGIKLILNPL